MSRALFESVDRPRAIVDRRGIADALAALPAGPDRNGFGAKLLRGALEQGRAEVARRLSIEPDRGRSAALQGLARRDVAAAAPRVLPRSPDGALTAAVHSAAWLAADAPRSTRPTG